VNKCNKANANITKDIDPKIIPFHKMCEALDGQNFFTMHKFQGIKIHSLTHVDVSYAAPQAYGIVNVALHREYSSGIVFIFSQGRKDLYHV
jgi:hypothetical protein